MTDDRHQRVHEAAPWLPPPAGVDLRSYIAVHLFAVPCLVAVLAWFVQHGSLDMAIARLFVDPASQRFSWHDSVVLDVVGHQAARSFPFLVGALAVAAATASLWVRSLRPWRPILLTVGASMLLGPLAVNALKTMTTQHCPTALQPFGGIVDYFADQHGPFWARSAQSAGHCLPSGHAGGGYALLSLYFAGWAAGRPRWRWRGLAIGIVAGLLFSVVRMMQGAHFASATIWSAAVDWTVCAALFLPLLCRTTARTG